MDYDYVDHIPHTWCPVAIDAEDIDDLITEPCTLVVFRAEVVGATSPDGRAMLDTYVPCRWRSGGASGRPLLSAGRLLGAAAEFPAPAS